MLLAAVRSSWGSPEKALLDIGGTPLWCRQRDLLASLEPAEIFLSAHPEQGWTRKAGGFNALLYDTTPGCGPISGITAAIERATQPHVVVLAINLPHMGRKWLAGLLEARTPGVGVVGRRGGSFEPLAAVYPCELMSLAWEALAGGKYGLQPLLLKAVEQGLMRVREIGPREAEWFAGLDKHVSTPKKLGI
ncbi:MAG: NTP transferase domain-containing protein [Opitutus sp.]